MRVAILPIATQIATHTRLLPVHTARLASPCGPGVFNGPFFFFQSWALSRARITGRSLILTASIRFSRTDSTLIE